MKTSKIAFWSTLILGFVFFPAHMIMIGIFLVLVAMAIGFILLLLKQTMKSILLFLMMMLLWRITY